MRLTLLLITLYIYSGLSGQVIPEERTVDWASAMEHISFNYPDAQVNVADFGATGNGVTNDYQAIADAIASLNGTNGFVYFPPGEYLIEETLYLPDSCILKGAGSEETTLLFNMGGNPVNCIVISKSQSSDFISIEGGLSKGNKMLTVESNEGIQPGDYIEIRQENGAWDTEPISWAMYSVGQVTRVQSVVGDKMIIIESPLRITYDLALNPEARRITPISNTGIQCMTLQRVDEPLEGAGSNIYFNMAANCYVKGVESYKSVGSHIAVYTSSNIMINGNYIHHAFTYDGIGTRGYGVTLNTHSGEIIITNNIFSHLRHAMMVKTGANGNIFGYNYSREPVRTEPISDASGDISLHGHYAFSNLFEGNINQNIVIDHYWGPSGPYNTFFRNQAELYGIIMTESDLQETNTQNFVGNDVTDNNFLYGLYILTGEDQFEYSNNVKGEIIPAGTNTLDDISYYLESTPEYWQDTIPWPATGTPLNPGEHMIPAKARYLSGVNLTICPDSVITNNHYVKEEIRVQVNPNPVRNILYIESGEKVYKTELLSVNNKKVYENNYPLGSTSVSLMLKDLHPGIYLVRVTFKDKVVVKKIIKQ